MRDVLRRTVLICLLTTSAWAQGPLDPALRGTEKLVTLLDRVSAVQRKTETLTAHFEQKRSSRILVAPSVSRGRFYYSAPDSVRWEYETPRVMTVLVSGGTVLTYRPAEKRAERIEVGRVQRKFFKFFGVGEPFDELRRFFTFVLGDPGNGAPYELMLSPTARQIKKRLKAVEVKVDRDLFLPIAISYTEADGDTTAYAFTDIVVNQPIAQTLFTITLPADVQVVEMKTRGND